MKCRQALTETVDLQDDMQLLSKFRGEIRCEAPNNNLTKFEGTLILDGQSHAIDNDKMLLRGCVLRNTKWCFGIVVFAGRDTKLMQNTGKTIFKRTSLDRLLNILILGVSVVFRARDCIANEVLRHSDCLRLDQHVSVLHDRLRRLGDSDWEALSHISAMGQ